MQPDEREAATHAGTDINPHDPNLAPEDCPYHGPVQVCPACSTVANERIQNANKT